MLFFVSGQTLTNIKPHLQNIAQTGSQALGLVANTLAHQQQQSATNA